MEQLKCAWHSITYTERKAPECLWNEQVMATGGEGGAAGGSGSLPEMSGKSARLRVARNCKAQERSVSGTSPWSKGKHETSFLPRLNSNVQCHSACGSPDSLFWPQVPTWNDNFNEYQCGHNFTAMDTHGNGTFVLRLEHSCKRIPVIPLVGSAPFLSAWGMHISLAEQIDDHKDRPLGQKSFCFH